MLFAIVVGRKSMSNAGGFHYSKQKKLNDLIDNFLDGKESA